MTEAENIKRCAIYTRKSNDEGLEQAYNSLDAQRESAENYIKSQKENGWIALPEHYDDGGFTGGNMDRPALKRLLADVEAGKVDIILIYKLDRLSRSLLDFMKLAEMLEQHHVSFVSVTQDINTSTSSGRMMLNILMTFSEFERLVIMERIRDSVAGKKTARKILRRTAGIGLQRRRGKQKARHQPGRGRGGTRGV
jgi:site-specific DNA recombinase